MDGINVLLEYFSVFKEIEIKNENNSQTIKNLDKIISILKNSENRSKAKIEYIVNYDLIEKLVGQYDSNAVMNELSNLVVLKYGLSSIDVVKSNESVPNYIKDMLNSSKKGIDNILYDVMLNVNRYNAYFMNKKVKKQDFLLSSDIPFDALDVNLKDVLTYLEVKEGELDKNLITDLGRYVNLDKFKKMAISIKTDMGLKRVLFDKIEDKNILVSILLHSNLDIIKSVGTVFENKNVNINKVVASIPSIFIKDSISSKCKYGVLTHFNNFMGNVLLIDELSLDFKTMINYPVFLINDVEKNRKLIERLRSINANVKNVLEHVGNMIVIKPDIVFNNINTLSLYGVTLTDDDNNYGYSILGMEELDIKLDYLIETGMWKKSDGDLNG